MKIEEKVFSYIEKYNMIETGSHVIVGLSGGADSVCLLFLLREYQKRKRFILRAVHVNHQIRGEEALRDQKFSENLGSELGIPVAVYEYPVPQIAAREKISLEEAGRNARREVFMQEVKRCRRGGQKPDADICIALAHHENDNAETVLHNLVRGTRISGLGGIRPVQKSGSGERYIRPLLCVSREEIRKFLQERSLAWVEDSSNEELEYTRNKIRHKIVPAMEEINSRAVSHISETARSLQKIEEYLQSQADILYKRYVLQYGNGYQILQELSEKEEIMQSYVIKRVLEEAAGQRRNIAASHIEAVQKLFERRTGAVVSLVHGLRAEQIYGNICISRSEEKEIPLCELKLQVFPYENQQIPEKTYTKWFDYDRIKQGLSVRRRLPGDYLIINQQGGRKKLKDYFIDCKIPRAQRDNLTLLADGSHILWIVGYRISEAYKVTSQTKQILKVQVKGVDKDE